MFNRWRRHPINNNTLDYQPKSFGKLFLLENFLHLNHLNHLNPLRMAGLWHSAVQATRNAQSSRRGWLPEEEVKIWLSKRPNGRITAAADTLLVSWKLFLKLEHLSCSKFKFKKRSKNICRSIVVSSIWLNLITSCNWQTIPMRQNDEKFMAALECVSGNTARRPYTDDE